jgi:hypothetical protein
MRPWLTPLLCAATLRSVADLSVNRMVAHNGEVLVTSEWAQRTGLNRTTIEARLNRGWSVERALTPIRGR